MSTKNGFNLRVIPGKFNDVSEELKATITPLQKGETKTYRLPVPVIQDMVKDMKGTKFLKKSANQNGYTWPMSSQIPTKDEIVDPFTGNICPIGVVRSYDTKTETIEVFPLILEQHRDGFVIITQGHVGMERFYAFMELTDYNGSKKDRDVTKPVYFYEVNAKADAEKRNKITDALTEELYAIKNMEVSELKLFCVNLKWDVVNTDPGVLKSNLKDFAILHPGVISTMYNNKAKMENLQLIRQAMDAGVLTENGLENKYTLTKSGKDIATFTRMDGKELIEQFAEWLGSHADGAKVKTSLKSQMQAKVPEPA